MKETIIRYMVDLNNPPPLTEEQKAELKALSEMPDSEIDFSDIPPLDEKFWKNAVRITLDELLAGVTPENVHQECNWGQAQGKEAW